MALTTGFSFCFEIRRVGNSSVKGLHSLGWMGPAIIGIFNRAYLFPDKIKAKHSTSGISKQNKETAKWCAG